MLPVISATSDGLSFPTLSVPKAPLLHEYMMDRQRRMDNPQIVEIIAVMLNIRTGSSIHVSATDVFVRLMATVSSTLTQMTTSNVSERNHGVRLRVVLTLRRQWWL